MWIQGVRAVFQVMIIAKVSSGANIAVTSQLAALDTKAEADAVYAGVEQQNKAAKPLPGFAAAAIKLY
jgi:hypothetical protein